MQAMPLRSICLWLSAYVALAVRDDVTKYFLEVEQTSSMASKGIVVAKHVVARDNSKKNPAYPDKASVPDGKVFWSTEWSEYKPVDWTAPVVQTASWADPMTLSANAEQWNDDLHRTYCTCEHGMSESSMACWGSTLHKEKVLGYSEALAWNIPHDGPKPLNPMGRTGMTGRGLLGKWGANHAADPLVTRLEGGQLQIVLIKRGDTGNTAIPGGMVEAGDTVSKTLAKEFDEEAVRGSKPSGMTDEDWEKQVNEIAARVQPLWNSGSVIYTGYVDDPRNTDNAWMETAAYHFHDSNDVLRSVTLNAGDDAVGVKWVNVKDVIADHFDMYASHKDLIKEMYSKHCQLNLAKSECQ